ncbi:YecA family protein [Ideonella sp. A 288]|uniref:YecA/YgfB family protein n=1 Tax=Ideonella sp. A 288 TaxID=1962181 RepID=UPI000B4B79CC|nr:YecA family protein [Ideonella sp. A 288]
MTPIPVDRPLGEADLDALEALLDSLPANREPLDVVMLDGYLCGVLLQPRPVPEAQWMARVVDIDGRAPPPGFRMGALAALVRRRAAELNRAIAKREWFDPWVYQLDDEASPSETVLPWVAGFANAMDAFPALMNRHEAELLEPLATLYRHFDPDDLEDADELLAEIETLEMPETLAEAVEDLVRSVLLMADVTRPAVRPAPKPFSRTPGGRARPAPGPRSKTGRRA